MTAIDEADKLAPCPGERDIGYYWVRHFRAEAPWQPIEYFGDGCWLAMDCDGIVREEGIAEVGPRFFQPGTPEATEAAAQALRERGWAVVEPGMAADGEQLAAIKRREERLHAALCEIANRAGREEGCGANWARNWALVTVEGEGEAAP